VRTGGLTEAGPRLLWSARCFDAVMPRHPGALAPDNGVYRTAGRETVDAPIAPPSRGALFSPLGRGLAWVLLLVIPPLVFNMLVAEPVFGISKELRFRPGLEAIQDVLAWAIVLSLPLLVHRIVTRVRPVWTGLKAHTKVVYVVSLVLAQTVLLLGSELALMESRGGLPLWEPHWRSTSAAPADSRTAYLFAGGFGCSYDVFVAEPNSLLMKRKLTISRNSCQEPTPRVDWKDDGTVSLVDASGKPVEQQSSSWGFLWGGGC
jgi:hypothetical protein